MDAVRRSCARPADRRGARQQPRPRARDDAHRAGARATCCSRSPTCIRASNLDVGASRSRITEVGLATVARGLRSRTSSNHRVGIAASLRARPVGQVPRRRRRPRRTSCSPRSTRAKRCAPRSPPKSTRVYFTLLAADAELALLRDTLKSRDESVALQRDRFDAGVIGELDLRQAEAERAAVVGDIARAERAIGAARIGARGAASGARRATCSRPSSRATTTRSACSRSPTIRGRAAVGPARAPARRAARGSRARRREPAHRRRARRLLPVDLAHRRCSASESAALKNLFSGPAADLEHRRRRCCSRCSASRRSRRTSTRRRRGATRRSSSTCRRCRPRSAKRTMRWSRTGPRARRSPRRVCGARRSREALELADLRYRVRLLGLPRGARLAAPAAAGGDAAHRRGARRTYRARRSLARARRRLVAGQRRGCWSWRRPGAGGGPVTLETLGSHFRGNDATSARGSRSSCHPDRKARSSDVRTPARAR